MKLLLSQSANAARQHPFVTGCLAVALLAGLVNYPLWQWRQEMTREHEAIRLKGERVLAALTDRVPIRDDLAALAAAQEIIDQNLVTEESMEVNLGYFYRLEKLNRVRLLRIDQMSAPLASPGAPFKTVPVSLLLAGTYRNALAFMRELESGPRVLRIRAFRLERTEPTGNDVQAVLSVDLLAAP